MGASLSGVYISVSLSLSSFVNISDCNTEIGVNDWLFVLTSRLSRTELVPPPNNLSLDISLNNHLKEIVKMD